MNYYTADLHFGHANAIKFDKRPWNTVEEMDREMIKRWNNKVTEEDDVYILGDVTLKYSLYQTSTLLQTLKGKKYLVRGNHDKFTMQEKFPGDILEWVKDYHCVVENGTTLVLCHYPIAVWDKKHRGSLHLYGHVHADGLETHPILKMLDNAYNVSASVNGYEPCTLEEVIRNNKEWRQTNKHKMNDIKNLH